MRSHLLTVIKQAFSFIISITAFYTFFWVLLSFIDLHALRYFVAWCANGLLGLIAVPASLVNGSIPIIAVNSIHAQINDLCAGAFEIALLLAIILATFDRSWRNRAIGCVFGIITVIILNPIRIATILAIGHYVGWQLADVSHDILFRLTLFLIIVGYYFLWYVKYESIKESLVHLFSRISVTKAK